MRLRGVGVRYGEARDVVARNRVYERDCARTRGYEKVARLLTFGLVLPAESTTAPQKFTTWPLMPLILVVKLLGLVSSGAENATSLAWLKFGSRPASSGRLIQRASIPPVGRAGVNVTVAASGAAMATENVRNGVGGPVSIGGVSIELWPIWVSRVDSATYMLWPDSWIALPNRSVTGLLAAYADQADLWASDRFAQLLDAAAS